MSNTATLIKAVTVLTITLLATGCNTMSVNMNSIKYGQLYTMQEALEEAATDCHNQNTLTRAMNWVVIGYNDLENSRKHMDKRSVKYAETRSMMQTLSPISARRVDSNKLCKQMARAAKQSQHYLANIDNETLISEQPIMLAIVQY